MNDSEQLAHTFLTSLQIGTVDYEPDGNVPPDFLVAGRIAVEVRRLNQNEEFEGNHRGLENAAKPLNQLITRVLRDSGPPAGDQSWFVAYDFRRPLPPWKELEAALRSAVRRFREHLDNPPKNISIGRCIRLGFIPAERSHETLLLLGGWVDFNSGGFVVAELIRNLRICIAEKVKKVSSFRHKYPEWWLLFDDRVTFGDLGPEEVHEVRSLLQGMNSFDRILLLNAKHPTQPVSLTHEAG